MFDALKEMQEKMKPVTALTEANQKAVEKIFALQSEYFTDCVNASLAQVKALAEVKEPKEVIQLQMEFLKAQEAKWSEVTEKELAAMTEVREQASALFEESLLSFGSDLPKFEMPAMDMSSFDLTKFDLSKFMPNVEAPEAEKTAKPAAARSTARKSSSAPATSTASSAS